MAERLRAHGPRSPRERVLEAAQGLQVCFFPNEVASLLAIREIDYHQLRRFYKLVRDPDDSRPVGRGWSRFSFTDLACLLVAIDLCGGSSALAPGRRLTLGSLQKTCAALRRQGYRQPLLEVRLVRFGRRFMADVDGIVIDPTSGQTLIRAAAEHADLYFDEYLLRDRDVARALREELKRHRPSGGR